MKASIFFFINITSLFFSVKAFSCDCENRKFALALYDAEVIFIGRTIQKTYSEDSSTYTIIFEVQEYFKNNRENQPRLRFTKTSEWKYSGELNSCSWQLGINNTWLVVANYEGDEVSFGLCSPSRPIDKKPITEEEQLILKNLEQFELSRYRFHGESGFSYPEPLTNVDSLLENYQGAIFSDQIQLIIFDIDKEGNLTAANYLSGMTKEEEVVDTIFNLNTLKNLQASPPKNHFEEVALEIARKIKKWTPKCYKRTGEAVLGRVHAYVLVNENGKIQFDF